MAESQAGNQLSAAFPPPPPFYKQFTAENLAKLKDIQSAGSGSHEESTAFPTELQCLVPPRPPTEGSYRSFGGTYELDEKPVSLPAQGIEQLFPSAPANSEASGTQSEWTLDRASELKKLAKSLLLNFLELVGVLSVNPEQYGRKIEDLRTLFVNTHHLLNEYRPHQARETLIFMMEQQLARSRAETEGIRNMKEKVDGILKGLGEQIDGLQGQEEVAKTKETNPEKNDSDHTRLVWEALEDELVEDEGDLQMS